MKIRNMFFIRLIRKNKLLATIAILYFMFFSFFQVSGQENKNALKSSLRLSDTRDPERTLTITSLQAGCNHYKNGNPGLEANFALFVKLARQAAAAQPHPDLICFPEYAISGWGYPPEKVINSIAEPIPGNGYWYNRYADLAREIGIPTDI